MVLRSHQALWEESRKETRGLYIIYVSREREVSVYTHHASQLPSCHEMTSMIQVRPITTKSLMYSHILHGDTHLRHNDVYTESYMYKYTYR